MASHRNNNWIAGLSAAIAASLCCIVPVLAIISGAGTLATSVSRFELLRPWFIGLSVAALGFAWFQHFRKNKTRECGCRTDKKNFLHSGVFLLIITITSVLLTAFPYYAGYLFSKGTATRATAGNNIMQAELEIKGMTCSACALHISSKLSKLVGVTGYQVSYKNGKCLVKFNNSIITLPEIENAIDATGYKVIRSSTIN